jgi:hypothetical protein
MPPIIGTATQGAPPQTLDDIPCPGGAWGPAPSGAGISLSLGTGDLSITTKDNVTFPAGTYYYHNFTNIGNGALRVAAGDSVDIYISGALDLQEQGIIDDNNAAGDFQLWGCSTDSSNWNIQSSITTDCTTYAPHHPIQLDDNGTRHGSLPGGDFTWPANGQVHYDASLAGDGKFVMVPGTWPEIIFQACGCPAGLDSLRSATGKRWNGSHA